MTDKADSVTTTTPSASGKSEPPTAPKVEVFLEPPEYIQLKRSLHECFRVFDTEGNDMIDGRDLGTVFRAIGCVPTEAALKEILLQVEDANEQPGYAVFELFMPVAVKLIEERTFIPSPYEALLQAFKLLDTENKGYLTKDELVTYMTEQGEPFSQEEMEEMLVAAVNPESGIIDYKDYASWLVVQDDEHGIYVAKDFLDPLPEKVESITTHVGSGEAIPEAAEKVN